MLQSRLTYHPGVAIMTRHITKPTPLPAVVRWPPSWTGRIISLERSFKPFLPFLEENLTPGYSLLPFFFCTDEGKMGESVMLLYFHSKNLLFAKHRRFSQPILFPFSLRLWFPFNCFLFVNSLMDPRALGKELPADNPLETALSRK